MGVKITDTTMRDGHQSLLATRNNVIGALEMLQNKTDTNPPKKHGNIPL